MHINYCPYPLSFLYCLYIHISMFLYLILIHRTHIICLKISSCIYTYINQSYVPIPSFSISQYTIIIHNHIHLYSFIACRTYSSINISATIASHHANYPLTIYTISASSSIYMLHTYVHTHILSCTYTIIYLHNIHYVSCLFSCLYVTHVLITSSLHTVSQSFISHICFPFIHIYSYIIISHLCITGICVPFINHIRMMSI